jgi:hypothetical protein
MTELTNTPERQARDLMDPDSGTADVPPDTECRTRGRRRYLCALVPAILLALPMLSGMHGCTALGAYSGITFDLTSVVAHASMPVHVRACIPNSCASFTCEQWGSGAMEVCSAPSCPPLSAEPWARDYIRIHARGGEHGWEAVDFLAVQVKDPALTFWRPIWVRLRVSDQAGNSIFDSSALVRPTMFQPNGPGCDPIVYAGGVVAKPTGRLVPQP